MTALFSLLVLAPQTWNLVERPPLSDWPASVKGTLLEVKGFNAEFSEAVAMLKLEDGRLRGIPYRALDSRGQALVDAWLAQNPPPAMKAENYQFVPGPYDPVKDSKEVNFLQTPHFVLHWGNQPSQDIAGLFKDSQFIQRNAAYLEEIREFFKRDGAFVPGTQFDPPRKLHVYITGTGLREHREGFAFGGWDIVMHPGAMAPGSTVVPHEFGHCIQLASGGFRNSELVGWFWESHANWVSQRFLPHYPGAMEGYMERAQYELTSSRFNYGSWAFLEILAENPKLGSQFNYDIWRLNRKNAQDQSIEDPLETIVRVGQQRGAFPKGWSDFGDAIGTLAARMAGLDHPQQFVWERTVRGMEERSPGIWRSRTGLDPIPGRPGWHAPWFSQAPRQFGFNLVDLKPVAGSKRIEAEFSAATSESKADWRVTLTAIDKEWRSRYSSTVRRGKVSLDVKPGDKRYVLAIAAAPVTYKADPFRPGYGRKDRYPYMVKFSGTAPMAERLRSPLPKQEGRPHPNGGGFVANSASVAATAFVGPKAVVLDQARVEGTARIEGMGVVRGAATVKDQAVVAGQAVVSERATLAGRARAGGGAVIAQNATVQGDASVQEAVHVLGDGVVEGNALLKGWGEVHTSKKALLTGDLLAGEDLEVHLSSSPVSEFKTGLFYGFMADAIFSNEVKDFGGQTAGWDFSKDGLAVKDSVGDHQGMASNPTRPNVAGRKGLAGGAIFDGIALDSREWTLDLDLYRSAAKPGTLLQVGGFAIKLSGSGDLSLPDGTKLGRLPLKKWTKMRLTVTPQSVQSSLDGRQIKAASAVWNRSRLNLRWLQLAPDFPGVVGSGRLWRRQLE